MQLSVLHNSHSIFSFFISCLLYAKGLIIPDQANVAIPEPEITIGVIPVHFTMFCLPNETIR